MCSKLLFPVPICGLALLLSLNSCKSVYHPNAVNTPLLENEGEFRAYIDPSNIQASYALTDHVGLMVNGFYVSERNDQNTIRGSGGLVELGMGYYTSFHPLIFELYGGGGRGALSFREYRQENGNTVIREFSASGTRFFLQPSVGLAGKYFEAGITPRFVLGKYDNISTNYSVQDQIDGKFYRIDQPTWVFIEPALTVRGGYKFIKLQVQYGFSTRLNDQPLAYKSSFLNVGVIFDINRASNSD